MLKFLPSSTLQAEPLLTAFSFMYRKKNLCFQGDQVAEMHQVRSLKVPANINDHKQQQDRVKTYNNVG